MNNILKKITLSVATSTLLFSADLAVDTVGINLGKAYTDHSVEHNMGSVLIPHHPYKNYTAIELFTTLEAINEDEDIKPYISYTYSKNDDMKHQYLLAGVNKYYKHETLDLYAGVVGGYGYLHWDYNPVNNTTDNKHSVNSFILGLQAGFEYPVVEKLALNFNTKYLLHDYDTHLEPTTTESSTVTHDKTLFIGLGLSYKFGEETPKDSDNDGVIDKIDQCPNSVANEIVDAKGCAKDSDNDGVKDTQDKCPNSSSGATVNSDGCPIDSDKDGIYDHLDKCPNTPEGMEVDSKGCSCKDYDDDNDGVDNCTDKCPNSQANEIVDQKGCEVIFTIRINFPSDSAVIDDTYMSKIKELSNFLIIYPTYKALIEAHTDSKGSEEYNQKLSEKRAKALYEKLLELEIDESRIAYKGLGETNPIATNDTEDGMALNRRIEVTFLKK